MMALHRLPDLRLSWSACMSASPLSHVPRNFIPIRLR
ncbi:hypothetical protein LAUMK35_00460 [Mycobacterium pseudokansasii]|uniref:Uncharacterized protein n=1 Tax=Mycobacterium pseudokansasii TaxID=2341080 RepID=A0A498QL24_9MYCO|nr:hypothetical protein LAUMK35_00460 [Mycobacterium pseudokansasii]VAZ88527.1 hypothetical protein LAUMK21_00460 [Mycobacterium pseudokansasii]VBA46365.1 hypothetical protein LAUMK142_00314 [Mycobacterium pseudokansasii]